MRIIQYHIFFLFQIFATFVFIHPGYSQDTTSAPLTSDTLLAKFYALKGDSLMKISAYDSSVFYFTKAAEIFEKSKLWDKVSHCRIWTSYGFMDLNRLDLALSNINEGIDILKNARHPNMLGIHECTNVKAEILYYLAKYKESLETLHEVIKIAPPPLTENIPRYNRLMAKSYFQFGNNYASSGSINLALEMYEKSLVIRQKYYKEDHFLIGDCYNNIGIMHIYLGDYDRAIRNVVKSTSIREKHLGPTHPTTAWSYNNLGGLYERINNFEDALKFHFKALEVRKKILPDNHRDLGASYMNIANVYNNTGEFPKAIAYHFKALEHYRGICGDDCIELVDIYNNIGDAYFKQEQVDVALTYFKKSENVLSRLNPNGLASIISTNYNIAEAFYYKNRIDSAVVRLQKFFDASNYQFKKHLNIETVSRVEILIKAITLKGKIHFSEFSKKQNIVDLKLAVSSYLEALDVIEQLRYSFFAEESKLFLSEGNANILAEAINAVHTLYAWTKEDSINNLLFNVMERGKTAILREMLNKSRATMFSNIPDSLVVKEKKLSTEIHSGKVDISVLREKNDSTLNEDISVIQDKLFYLENEYEVLLKQLEIEHPRYKHLKFAPKIPSAASVSAQLDTQTALLNYFITDTSLYIHTITHETSEYCQLAIDSFFEETVFDYLRCIKKNRTGQFSKLSTFLREKLIKPVEQIINSKQSLIIIPDKYLSYLPFETLCSAKDIVEGNTSNYDFLVKKFDISYHYSATLYQQILLDNPDLPINSNGIIGFAPVFNNDSTNSNIASIRSSILDSTILDNSVLRSLTVDGIKYEQLTYSEEEVKSIAKMFEKKGRRADTYYHSMANETTFKSKAGNYKYVHLATHGFINENNPNLSGIVFSQTSDSITSTSADNILFAGEMFNLDLNADLVVLSACETGLGKIVSGEGIMSMTRGLIYAGVPNIIFSLWKVGDKNTCALMKSFYTQMLGGKSYAQALRQAKLELINLEATAFPSNWAGFTLLGVN